MMVIVYVDDLLIFAKSDNLIEDFITSMQREEICLRREGTAEGYLGVDIQHINGKIHLTQSGLSQRIITAMGLTKYSNSCPTPAEVSPLPKDIDGDKASGTINYGWLLISTTAGLGFPMTVHGWCFDDSGAAVTIPADALFADGYGG